VSMPSTTPDGERHGGCVTGRCRWALRATAGQVAGSLVWLAVAFVGRARWFDLRCLRQNESSVSMDWVGWFPPHFRCLDTHGQTVVRDYTEALWLLVMWGPVVAGAAVLLWSWHRSRVGGA
jgi:hypothetical protein